MSFIRAGHPLMWFDDRSDLYVFGRSDKDGIEDYGGSPHMPSVIEHIGNMIYRQTEDFDYATLMVIQLADASGCMNKLRLSEVNILEGSVYECRDRITNEYVESLNKMIKIYEGRKRGWSKKRCTDE